MKVYNAKIRAWKQKEKLVVGRLVHLDVEDCSEELLRQQSYAIKNQLGHPKPPTRGFGTQNTPIGGYFACPSLVLYGIRAPIIGPFRAWKPPILIPRGVFCVPKPLVGGFGCDELVLYGIRELAPATLWTNGSQASRILDQ